MNALQGIIIGIVQGLSEFLPISSSGHIVLAEKIMGLSSPGIFFEVMLHVGTLFAVLVFYRKLIFKMIKKPFTKYTFYLVIATVPSVIVALLFKSKIESSFGGSFLGFAFLITSAMILIANLLPKGDKDIRDMNVADAGVIGLFQAAALFPGVSRSGATITGALFRKLDRKFAAEFSFLLSIPAILGSLVLQIYDIIKGNISISSIPVAPVIFGMIFAFISGLIAIGFMVKLITNNKLKYLAYYTAILGVLVIIDQNFTHLVF